MKKVVFTAIVLLISGAIVRAADYYWVGGTGNWNDFAAHWATTSGGSTFQTQAPTSLDNVYFDANSFTAAGQIVTINVDALCANMSWAGVLNNPQIAGATARKLSIYGSLTLISGMNYNFLGDVYFESLSTGRTITCAGQSFKRNVYFQGVGGWILQDAFVQTNNYYVYHNFGTLNLNNQNFSCYGFISNNTNVRNLQLGSSIMTITRGSNDAMNINGTNMTLNSGTSLIKFTGPGGGMYNYYGGGLNFYDVTCEAVTGTSYARNASGSFHNIVFNSHGVVDYTNTINSVIFAGNGTVGGAGNNIVSMTFNGSATINDNATYGTIIMNGNGSVTGSNTIGTLALSPGKSYTFTYGKTQLITTDLIANGTCAAPISLQSSSAGNQSSFSKTGGAVTINYCILGDMNASGGATFTANNSINLGNNSGWTINPPAAQNLYWVGGTGNWNDPAHWSLSSGGVGGACIPTSLDNVYFDANSFSASGQTVTIIGDENGKVFCKNMTWFGVTNNPTLAGTNDHTLNIFGSLTLSPSMTYNFNGLIYFLAESGGNTIYTAGLLLNKNHMYLSGQGGGWTLMDGLNLGSKYLYHVRGSLTTNNQPITAYSYSSVNTNVRSLNLGSSLVTLSKNSHDAMEITGTNMTLNAGTSLIKFTAVSGGMYNPSGGGLNFYDVLCEAATGTSYVRNSTGSLHNIVFNSNGFIDYTNTINSVTFAGTGSVNGTGNNIASIIFTGAATINDNGTYGTVVMNDNGTITGNNTFGSLTFSAGKQYTLTSNKTQTITGDLIANGTSTQIIIIKSSTAGTQSTLSKASGTVTVNYVSLKDNKATGGATFIANNSIDLGNNSGWIINAPGGNDYYWVGGTGNWNDASKWSLSSGGGGGAGVPTSLDNVYFDANSFTAPGQVVTVIGDASNNASCIDMDWTGITNNPTLTGAATQNFRIYGSMTLSPDLIYTFAGPIYFEATDAGHTIFTGGLILNKNHMYFQGEGGGWSLMDALNIGAKNLYHIKGTLTTNNFPLTAYIYNSNYTNVRALNLGSSIVTISYGNNDAMNINGTNMTLNAGTSLIKFTGTSGGMYNPSGGGLDFWDVLCEAVTGTGYVRNADGSFNNIVFNSNGVVSYTNTINSVTFTGDGTINDNGNNIATVVFNAAATINGNGTYGDVTINGNGSITGNNTISNLTFSAGKQYTLTSGKTQTITGDLIANGTNSQIIVIKSSTAGLRSTLSKSGGTVTVNYVSLKDNNATGGATFIANNSIDLGNNLGWIINSGGSNDFYWVGGTGNWNDAAKWSLSSGGAGGAGVPTSLDNVFFDANSFSASGQIVTVIGDASNNASCIDMDWTGVTNNPTLAGASTQNFHIYGSMILSTNMTYTFAGPIYFDATTTGNTIFTGGQILNKNHMYFQGEGGGWSLMDALNIGAKNLYHIKGTLTTNNFPLTAYIYNSNYTNVRALNLGSSVVTISYANTDAMNINGTNMTLNAGTSLIKFTGTSGGMYNPSGGGLDFWDVLCEAVTGTGYVRNADGSFNNIVFNSNGVVSYSNTINSIVFAGDATIQDANSINSVVLNGNASITGNNTFGTLEAKPGKTLTFTYSKTQTIVNDLIIDGTCLSPIILQSSSATTQTTISKASGTVSINRVNLQGMNATGGATFIANNAIDLGNNTGWTLNAPGIQDLYWVGGTGNWDDISHWSFESGGAGGYCIPTQQDNVIFDENSFTQEGQGVFININNASCRDMDWSAATNAPTFTSLSNTYTIKIYGSLILSPDMNFAYAGYVNFEGGPPAKSTYDIFMAGKSFSNNTYFNGVGGAWTLLDDFGAGTNNIYLNFGTLITNGKTVSCERFISTNNNVRSLNMGASVYNISYSGFEGWYVTGSNFSIIPGTSEIRIKSANGGLSSSGASLLTYNKVVFENPGGTSSLYSDDQFSSVSFSPAGVVYGGGIFDNITFYASGTTDNNNTFGAAIFLGNATIRGNNTFNTLTFTPGKLCKLEAGKTQTIINEMVFWGNISNPITLQSLTAGSQATVSKASGTVEGNYILLKDMKAIGGATFNLFRSTDQGNNTGWNFLSPPAPVCPADMSICLNTPPFALSGATPAGGTYSGTGVSGGVFSPSVAGAGNHIITYTYIDPPTGYADSCTFLITVKTLPVVTCPTYSNVCLNANPFALTGGLPPGGSYSGPGVSGGIFFPISAGPGTHVITYTAADPETGCFDQCSFEITVDDLPVVTCPQNMTVYITDPSFTLTATPPGGIYTGPGISGDVFSPSSAGTGVHSVTYTYTDPQTGCVVSCTFTITVYLSQTINYVTGWNWISFNVLPTSATVNNVLAGFPAQNGDVLKNQGQSFLFNGTSWVPNLLIDPDKTYLLKTARPNGNFKIIGFAYVNQLDPITINANGWTWIGYKPRVQMTPAQAFVSMAGTFTNGDVVKTQAASCLYSSGNWLPPTFKLNPGVGYKLKYQRTPGNTLIYPASDGSGALGLSVPQPTTIHTGDPCWATTPGMETNMSIFVTDAILGNLPVINGKVAAFDAATGQCRGVEDFINCDIPGQAILTVGFNSDEEGNRFYYKVWDADTKTVFGVNETGTYVGDDILKVNLNLIPPVSASK